MESCFTTRNAFLKKINVFFSYQLLNFMVLHRSQAYLLYMEFITISYI
ncbi:hypothetical protein D1BOALGB6SA_6465 [Olavius sp. associated proteobacterium Delta 1]|nr:hypothetical protein D1BOALGB6SA_6465 [Olavius sp. associated proteobacterium Delta 1]